MSKAKKTIDSVKSGKTVKSFHREAKAILAKIAAERDKLRDLLWEYDSILEDVGSAHDDFERALDTLSQYL